MAEILLLATLDTKGSETTYLAEAIGRQGHSVEIIDLSLGAGKEVWPGERKLARMKEVVEAASSKVAEAVEQGARVAVGLGGGSGGEMILRIMEAQPVDFPQVLVTTLPFDPRPALARTGIILVPTLIDFSGLNAAMRAVLDRAAVMIAGLAGVVVEPPTSQSIAISVLGATQGAADGLNARLRLEGVETSMFHANGYGGAALVRFAREGRFKALVELTPHELTRMHIAGAHVPMPDRFSSAAELDLPQIVLPGALNFIGLGAPETVPAIYRSRAHYAHSGFFTHVKVTESEMGALARLLAEGLNRSTAPATVIVPMGGFSHQDTPGGAIEDESLRHAFLSAFRAVAMPAIRIVPIDAHINQPETTATVLAALKPFLH
jgi:uncharacterized protein (UPF0261 family)